MKHKKTGFGSNPKPGSFDSVRSRQMRLMDLNERFATARLLFAATILVAEFADTTFGIDDLLLTREKRVA